MHHITEIHVRIVPKASANRVVPEEMDASQEPHQTKLKIYVTAVPEDGKANAAMFKLLAEYFDLPKSAFRITRGDTSRNKIVKIAR